jgi:transcription elongation factor GreA
MQTSRRGRHRTRKACEHRLIALAVEVLGSSFDVRGKGHLAMRCQQFYDIAIERELEHLLRTAEVRDVVDSGRVEVGSVVTVVDGDGDEMQYFVAPQENKVPGLLLASPTSPLGGALLGAGVGDEVAYDAPAGTLKVTIKSVRPYEA